MSSIYYAYMYDVHCAYVILVYCSTVYSYYRPLLMNTIQSCEPDSGTCQPTCPASFETSSYKRAGMYQTELDELGRLQIKHPLLITRSSLKAYGQHQARWT